MFRRRSDAPDKIRVGDVLVHKGLIAREDLAWALLEQQKTKLKLGEVLVEAGLVTDRQLKEALTEQKWRNWTAVALFTLSSLVAIAPKLVDTHPVVAVRQSDQNAKTRFIGGSNLTASNSLPSDTPQTTPSRYPAPAPLAMNPTVNSPLVGFCHPLNGLGYVSQGIRGTTHQGRMEYAYDLAIGIGTPVYAMRAGEVIGVQDKYPDTGGGPDKVSKFNYVMVEHDGGYRSVYIHLQQGFRGKVQIKAGDRVEAGQLIGYSGNSGWSSGPHLHLEVQEPGSPYTFTQTEPFSVAGMCQNSTVARAGS
ncbi:MAG: peptidoglycan DD-metalloendopeptidase family protein [Acaryochloridaceae cyanobacterium RU_4_10]|nr:peptidoglycan DD-metalloendopeptidase family protein [Acaryochloridaceae cyanobacterium RU_4_10]